eukprot:CAMPEP_0198546082 /NCGR_PEP_ID=MMETSP1462-20131121/66230_1 /TAXON_ID=1333877 /ORGANISM="Brandtodinium nutriculum, Strain RCC3387" /LENGTH=77 /DNA_ID=CAMNT_0044276511 /DNA_START=86 /DNA_END=316 /DNA_ORIENTATION=+
MVEGMAASRHDYSKAALDQVLADVARYLRETNITQEGIHVGVVARKKKPSTSFTTSIQAPGNWNADRGNVRVWAGMA